MDLVTLEKVKATCNSSGIWFGISRHVLHFNDDRYYELQKYYQRNYNIQFQQYI